MLETLDALPPDPILGLISAYARDPNPQKVDLGAGVYRDVHGRTPVFAAVREAERQVLGAQETKSYVAPPGDPAFLQALPRLLLGDDHPAVSGGRVAAVQAPGGCGALRLGAELVERATPGAPCWVSTPTWPNHIPLLGDAGLRMQEYAYYDGASHEVDFEAMAASLRELGPGDVVVLHLSCHNPCGADLTREQWDAVADLAEDRGFTPFVDVAYHGLGEGLAEDAYGVRLLAARLPEVLVAYSCSKNFGLYRERAGAALVVSPTPGAAVTAGTQLNSIARGIYSMPPAHGAAIVGTILGDADLKSAWAAEVASMRERINGIRRLLADELAAAGAGDFSFLAAERGMFSFLGVSPDQAARLRDEHSVYLMDSSRINVAGVTEDNVGYLAKAVAAVVGG